MTDTASELSFPTTVWLQQGLRLKDILVRLAGATLVESFVEADKAFRSLPWRRPGSAAPITTEQWRVRKRHEEAHHACVTPLKDALDRGRVIAVRPDFNTCLFVRLLPPATGWNLQIFDVEKSLIFHPKSSYQSLFVLFAFADQELALAPETPKIVTPVEPTDRVWQPSRSSSKDWLKATVQRIPPDDRDHGWKRRYAQKLATVMAAAAKTHRTLKPLQWQSIVARLNELKLWPVK